MQSGSADVSDMRVGRLSNPELVTAEAGDKLFDAAHKMDRKHVGALPVLDDRQGRNAAPGDPLGGR